MNEDFQIMPQGGVTTPQGFQAAGLHCGIKKTSRYDLGAICSQTPAAAAAVYMIRRKQLEKLAQEKPEEFAKLLRSWIGED